MTVYDLYLESGPKHRKTMVHVPQLLGCVAVGSTTEAALEATPDAITAFRRFLSRHGEEIDVNATIEVRVLDHITEGQMLGEGMPYVTFPTDHAVLTDEQIERLLVRLGCLNHELGSWSSSTSTGALDHRPEKGRAGSAILLHVLGAQGSYLASAFGSAPGFGPIHRRAELGEIPLAVALHESVELCKNHVAMATPEQRQGVRQMKGYLYTLHKALRRMNEHAWEHLAELSRRPKGPVL